MQLIPGITSLSPTTRQEIIRSLLRQMGENEETEHLLDWIEDMWETIDILGERFGAEQARQMIEAGSSWEATMSTTDSRPTFQEVREKHGIALDDVIDAIDLAISPHAIQIFDRTGKGFSFVVVACLDALSALTEETYNRENVGGIKFLPFLERREPCQSQLPSGCCKPSTSDRENGPTSTLEINAVTKCYDIT